MEKSKNFRIDALLAEETHRGNREVSPGLNSDSPTGSPVSCRRADTPSPRGTALHLQPGIIPKPGLLNLPHPGLTSLPQGSIPGMYTAPMYPLSALGGQHPALAYSGFTQLAHPYPEHLKAAAMAGSLPLEHWIRAGIMLPRLPDYTCEWGLYRYGKIYIYILTNRSAACAFKYEHKLLKKLNLVNESSEVTKCCGISLRWVWNTLQEQIYLL